MSTSASPELEKKPRSPLLVKTFKGPGEPVRSIVCFKDGKRIISGNRDGTVWKWNLENLQPEGEILMHEPGVWDVILSPDERKLLCVGRELILMWDLEGRSVVWTKSPGIMLSRDGAAYSPDGQMIAVCCRGKEILLLNVETGDCIRELQFGERALNVAFSPDCTRLAAGAADSERVRVYDVATGETIVGPFGADGTSYVRALAFTNDGQQIFTFTFKFIHAWNAATGRIIGDPIPVNEPLSDVIAMSPDGRRVASRPLGGPVSVWDLTTGRQIGGPFQGEHEICAFAWSPTGSSHAIVTGDMEGNTQVWDVSPLNNVTTSTPPAPHLPGTSSSRASSLSSSILNLSAGPDPTPHSPESSTRLDKDANWEYDTDASFDSLMDLPMDGTQPAQRRKRRRRRNVPVTSPASPLISSASLTPQYQQHQVPPATISSPNATSIWTRNRRNPRGEQPAQPDVTLLAKASSKSKSKPSVANTEPSTSVTSPNPSGSPPSDSKSIISLVRAHLRRDEHATHDPAHLPKYSPIVKVSPAQAFSRIAKARPRDWDKRRPRRVAPQEPGQEQAVAQGQEQGPGQAQGQGQAQVQGDSAQAPGPIQRQRTVSARGSYEWVRQHVDDEPEEGTSALADVEVGCWDLFRAAIEYTFTRRKDRQESE